MIFKDQNEETVMNDMIGLTHAVELYFQALYECNLVKFDKIFDPLLQSV